MAKKKAKKKATKKLTEKQLLQKICEYVDENDKTWYQFLTKGSSKENVESLYKKKLLKKAGKGGYEPTAKGWEECGYE